MKRIVYTNNEGGVSIVCPSASWASTMEKLALKVVPEGIPYEIVDAADIPTDREFRNAWEYDKGFKINVAKKQVILDKRADKEKDVLIQAKIREQAITALKAEGKLTADGKLVVSIK